MLLHLANAWVLVIRIRALILYLAGTVPAEPSLQPVSYFLLSVDFFFAPGVIVHLGMYFFSRRMEIRFCQIVWLFTNKAHN